MKKVVIFDFNRTIYDPEAGRLVKNARFTLRTLLRRGFYLYLISYAGESRRRLIKNLNIDQYFRRVMVTRTKSKKDFERIVNSRSVICSSSFVIGDRVRKEIKIGNLLGMQTIWVRGGKFAKEFPRRLIERPTYAVIELKNILNIVH